MLLNKALRAANLEMVDVGQLTMGRIASLCSSLQVAPDDPQTEKEAAPTTFVDHINIEQRPGSSLIAYGAILELFLG